MTHHTHDNFKHILTATGITAGGLLLFKYIPMWMWGNNILYDASGHMASTILMLYIIWFFIDENKKWRIPYFFFATLVLVIISLHRIIVNAHNDVGLLGGLAIGLTAVGISHWRALKKKIKF